MNNLKFLMSTPAVTREHIPASRCNSNVLPPLLILLQDPAGVQWGLRDLRRLLGAEKRVRVKTWGGVGSAGTSPVDPGASSPPGSP